MNKRILVAVLGAAVLMVGGAAQAQKKGAKADGGYQKVKSYDFSGDSIDGELVKPDGDNLRSITDAKHTSLIRVRTNFIREIVKSAEDI